MTLRPLNYAYALFLAEKYAEPLRNWKELIAANQKDGDAYFFWQRSRARESCRGRPVRLTIKHESYMPQQS